MDSPTLLDTLLAEVDTNGRLDLDRFATLVAPHDLSVEELDACVTMLEGRGVTVEAASSPDLRRELAAVLPVARRLQAESGVRPTIEAIAREAGLSREVVWRALRYGRVLGR
jgi:hypothetical protein